MPPKDKEIILICPKCNRNGYLKKKTSKFHLPQKNKIITFNDCLDYLSKLHFKDFANVITVNHNEISDNLPLKHYYNFYIFYKIPINKIKAFEISVIKSLIRKYIGKQYNITYSKDLTKSSHLQNIIRNDNCEKKHQEDQPKNKVIFISRLKLIDLFSSILISALNKCCELNELGIDQKYEIEMVEGIKSIFYPMTLNIDKRNEWNFPLFINPNKIKLDFSLRLEIPDNSDYRKKCKECGITFPKDNKLLKCECGSRRFFFEKEKPSRDYLKNKDKELEYNETKMNEFFLKFLNFMHIMKNDWFSIKEIKADLLQFFDTLSKEILDDLKMPGKNAYIIRHYCRETSSKEECYISKKSDFMNIYIKLIEYIRLIKSLIKAEINNREKNINKMHYKLITILKQRNFPERYIRYKIRNDYLIFLECIIRKHHR
jgi:hypothetical protein